MLARGNLAPLAINTNALLCFNQLDLLAVVVPQSDKLTDSLGDLFVDLRLCLLPVGARDRVQGHWQTHWQQKLYDWR